MSTTAATMVGETLGHWSLVAELGAGAFGVVYEARHTTFYNRHAAVKVLRADLSADEAVVRRFLDEANAASLAEHENIVQIFDGEVGGAVCYLAMELLRGSTLEKVIKDGRLDLRRTINVGVQVAGALHAAHRAGIVHRDLKAENIMIVQRASNPEFVKVLDFGIAKLRGGLAVTPQGMTIGTPAYMAPEQWMGLPDIDGRTDIYALGIILYECLAGSTPFVADDYSGWSKAHLNQAMPPLPKSVDASPGMIDLMGRMLAKRRENRPGDMLEVIAALNALKAGRVRPPSDTIPDAPWQEETAARLAPPPTPSSSPTQAFAARRSGAETQTRQRIPGGHLRLAPWLVVVALLGLVAALAWLSR